MTHDEYAALVARLEPMAAAHPTQYRVQVGVLAALGYAYAIGVVLFLVAAIGLLIWGLIESRTGVILVKLALPLLALLGAIGRAFWVSVPPPKGRVLARAEAPTMFAEIDAVRRAVNAPAPHRVIITDELNASVQQVPRLGIFGWNRSYLAIGLPLLSSLTRDQFRAVLAHEFGHLSRSHARFGSWMYRVRGTWRIIEQAIHERRSQLGRLLVDKFVDWYEPYFRAYSFVLARLHEVEADRTAAKVAGAQVAAQALVALEIRSRYMNDVLWPRVSARIVDEPTPPRTAFTGLVERIPDELPVRTAEAWLDDEMRVSSGVDDPHPPLAERLESLGVSPYDRATLAIMTEQLSRPLVFAETAASHLLGALAPSLASELDERWCDLASASWKDRHRHLAKAKAGLSQLADSAKEGPLTPDQQFRMADWTEDLQGSEAAMPIVAELVENNPTHASGLFMLGRMLLDRRDDAGVAHLERVIAIDPNAAGAASALIARHLQRVGRGREAITYRTRAEAALAEEAAAQEERRKVEPHDTLATAPLEDAQRTRLREQLQEYPAVDRAWIGRKMTRYGHDNPFLVLAVLRVEAWWRYESEGSRNYLVSKLAESLELPAGTLIVMIDQKRRWLQRSLSQLESSEVYRRVQ
jgi:Zn-dependent protease with chaperone function